MLDLLLLGTGAMVPLPDRALSSLLVRSGGRMALFDCGEGTQVQMRRFHWGFRNLDVICISHLHADHVLGLPGLFHTVANAGRTEPVFVYGPVGTNEVIHGLRVVARYLPFELVVHELADGDVTQLPGGMRGTVAEASHRIPCLAWRVDIDRAPAFDPVRAEHLAIPRTSWSRLQRGEPVAVDGRIVEPAEVLGEPRDGIAFGFVTDTRPTTRISALIEGVDLLVCESTYALDEDAAKAERHGHMTLRQACELAAGADAGRLWLTHFGGGIDDPRALAGAARNMFPNAEPGYAGLSARLSFEGGYVPLSSQSNAPEG